MTPRFATAIDSIYLFVLDLLDRIGQNKEPDVTEAREQIRGQISRAEAKLGEGEDWLLAKYALVVWIDEMLIDAPWDGRGWWESNGLEFEMFKTNLRAAHFYLKATEAAKLTKKDALEVFYVCVVLGFQGIYRDPSGTALAEELGLPPDLPNWARKTRMAIQLGQGRPPIKPESLPGQGAPPLDGQFNFLGASLLGGSLAVMMIVMAYFMFV